MADYITGIETDAGVKQIDYNSLANKPIIPDMANKADKSYVDAADSALGARIDAAVSSMTVDSEVQDIRVGADGVTYDSAGTAVRNQCTNIKAEIRELSMNYINVDNVVVKDGEFALPLEFVNRTISSSNGELGAYASNRCSTEKFYLVPSNVDIVVTKASNIVVTIFGYSLDYSYIGSDTVAHADYKYIRVFIRKQDNADITPTEAQSLITVKYVGKSNFADMINERVKKVIGKNLLDTTKTTVGYILNKYGDIQNVSSYRTSDFIFLKSGESVVISPSARMVLLYDTNKASIQSSYMNTETSNYTITVSSDCYIRFSYRLTNEAITQIEYGTSPTSYEPYKLRIEDNISLSTTLVNEVNALVGAKISNKRIFTFGDSIVHGAGNNDYGILDILIEKFGCTGIDYSVSGASCAYDSSRSHIVAQIQSSLSATKPDVIIIDGLSNDIVRSTKGELTSSFDYTTKGYANFVDGLEYCFGLIKANFADIPTVYILPHSSNGRDYAKELEFGNLARDICNKWSIPCVDVYKDGNLTSRVSTQLQMYTNYPTETSGTHPNLAGYEHSYIPLIVAKFNEIL